jgi:GNAT superfamily N-acetyltransferase
MTPERLTKPSQVLTLWPFFVEGFEALSHTSKEHFEIESLKKYICLLVTDSARGFIAVCSTDNGDPVAFVILHETTLPYHKVRKFETIAMYYSRNRDECVMPIVGLFETWAKRHGIGVYTLTTHRNTGAAIRFYRHSGFHFQRMFFGFERQL